MRTNKAIEAMLYEPETLHFWEKLFKENRKEKLKDRLHFQKKNFLLKKLAKFYLAKSMNITE